VFAPSWQLVADADELATPPERPAVHLRRGRAARADRALARDEGGELHAFSNVCTHRANLVVEKKGTVPVLRCRYQRAALRPRREVQVDARVRAGRRLSRARRRPAASPLERWSRFLFTSLQPAVPFAEWSMPLRTKLAGRTIDQGTFAPERSRDYELAANWALYVDNYLEGFHIPYVHAGLNDVIDYGSYTTEPLPWGVLQTGHAKTATTRSTTRPARPTHRRLLPVAVAQPDDERLPVGLLGERGAAARRRPYARRVPDLGHGPSEARSGAPAPGLHDVELEDEAVVETVMAGDDLPALRRGRYSPARESGFTASTSFWPGPLA
jgi:choline monooxygenase